MPPGPLPVRVLDRGSRIEDANDGRRRVMAFNGTLRARSAVRCGGVACCAGLRDRSARRDLQRPSFRGGHSSVVQARASLRGAIPLDALPAS